METNEQKYVQLEETLKHHTDWVSVTAHELKTSLAANKWILKMFLDGDFGTLTPEQMPFLKKSYDCNERMICFVGEMLKANHSQDLTIVYTLESTDITRIIEDTLFMFNAESYKRQIELVFLRPEEPLPPLMVDREKLRVVLENIIENAIKYSNEHDKIIIGTLVTPEEIRISVKDTGIGIPTKEQKHIFEKSYRASNAVKQQFLGNGIGLYASKIIIEKHGGTLTFESIENQGTTMVITLPRIRREI